MLGNTAVTQTLLNGNVGIGTTSPDSSLQVIGASHLGNTVINTPNGVVVSPNAGGQSLVQFKNGSGTIVDSYNSYSDGNFYFDHIPSSGAIVFRTNSWNERIRIDSATGNVGIGTTSPLSRLSIQGSGNTSASSALNVTGLDGGSHLVVRDDGNVGIGTTAPTEKLQISQALNSGDSVFLKVGDATTDTNVKVGTLYVPASGTFPGIWFNQTTPNSSNYSFWYENGQTNINALVNKSVEFRVANGARLQVGANGVTINGAGNVLPSYPLQVNNAAKTATLLTVLDAGNVGIGTTSPFSKLSVSSPAQQDGTLPLFTVASTTNTNLLTVLGNGNVGIGTKNPVSALNIVVQQNNGSALGQLQISNTGASNTGFSIDAGTQSNSFSYMDADTSIKMNEMIFRDRTNTVNNFAAFGLSRAASPNGAILTGMDRNDFAVANMTSGKGIYFGTNDGTGVAVKMVVLGTGNVGIGTTSPFAKFSVGGSSYFGGNLTATGTLTVAGASSLVGNVVTTGSVNIGTTLDIGGQATFGSHFTMSNEYASIRFAAGSGPYITTSGTFDRLNFMGGNIGIGTTTPVSTLSVQGSLCVRNTGSCGTTAGTIYASTASITAIDLAENYPTIDETLSAGEIVMFDATNKEHVSRAVRGEVSAISDIAVEPVLAGVISTAPGLILGGENATGMPVALSGRVPVKVNLEAGDISIGDLITISSVPGVGRKAVDGENAIGIALEAFNSAMAAATGSDTTSIVVFVNLQKKSEFKPALDKAVSTLNTKINAVASSTELYVSSAITSITSNVASSTELYVSGAVTSLNANLASSTASLTADLAAYFASSTAYLNANLASTTLALQNIQALNLAAAFAAAATTSVSSSTITDGASTSNDFVTEISTTLVSNTDFLNAVSSSVVASTSIASDVSNVLASSTAFMNATASSTALALTANSSIANAFVQSVATAVKDLIATAGDWMVQKFTAKIAYIGRVEAETVAISKGMEIVDQASGGVWCVTIKNGDWSKVQGRCEDLSGTTTTVSSTTPAITPITTIAPVIVPVTTTSTVSTVASTTNTANAASSTTSTTGGVATTTNSTVGVTGTSSTSGAAANSSSTPEVGSSTTATTPTNSTVITTTTTTMSEAPVNSVTVPTTDVTSGVVTSPETVTSQTSSAPAPVTPTAPVSAPVTETAPVI